MKRPLLSTVTKTAYCCLLWVFLLLPSCQGEAPPWAEVAFDLRREYLRCAERDGEGAGYPGIRWVEGRPAFAPERSKPGSAVQESWLGSAEAALEKKKAGETLRPEEIEALLQSAVVTGDKKRFETFAEGMFRFWEGSADGVPIFPESYDEILKGRTALWLLKARRLGGLRCFDGEAVAWAESLEQGSPADSAVELLAWDVSRDEKRRIRALRAMVGVLRRSKPDPEGSPEVLLVGACLCSAASGGAFLYRDQAPWVEAAVEAPGGVVFWTSRKAEQVRVEFANLSEEAVLFSVAPPHEGASMDRLMTYQCRVVRRAPGMTMVEAAAGAAGDIRFEAFQRAGFEAWAESADVDGPPKADSSLKVFLDEVEAQKARLRLTELAVEEVRARRAEVRETFLGDGAPVAVRRARLRAEIIEDLGGLPERGPLNAERAGASDLKGFRWEGWVVESLPGVPLSIHGYLPTEADGPLSVVLVDPGTTAESKKRVRNLCSELARSGLAAWTFEPLGPDEGSTDGAGGFRDLNRFGMLIGDPLARYRLWDSIRAVDFIVGHGAVDGKRLGVVGFGSGAGWALLHAAMDERVRVAAVGMGRDEEDGPPASPRDLGLFGAGSDPVCLGLLTAPRPLSVHGGAEREEEWDSTAAAYGLKGASSEFEYVISSRDGDRGWRAAEWVLHRLTEGERSLHRSEQAMDSFSGAPLGLSAGVDRSESLLGRLRSRFEASRSGPSELPDGTAALAYRAGILERIREVLDIPKGPLLAEVDAEGGFQTKDVALERIVLRGRDGFPLPGLLLVPKDRERRETPVLHIGDRGKIGTSGERPEVWAALLNEGYSVFSFDPRGMGETAVAEATEEVHMARLEVGESLLADQVKDVLTAVEFVTGRGEGPPGEVIVVGEGAGAVLALHGSALSERVATVVSVGALDRFESATKVPAMGILSKYDLPDVVAAIAPRNVLLSNSVDSQSGRLRSAEGRVLYDRAFRQSERLGGRFDYELCPTSRVPARTANRLKSLEEAADGPPEGE